MAQPANRYAPIAIAIAILLLPLLYIGSYFALVIPPSATRASKPTDPRFWEFNSFGAAPAGHARLRKLRLVTSAELINQDFSGEDVELRNDYRWGQPHALWFFWPVEQIDRRLR